MEYYFNVACRGRHLFRTDKYDDKKHADDIQLALAAHFRAEDGYTIERAERCPGWTCQKVAN